MALQTDARRPSHHVQIAPAITEPIACTASCRLTPATTKLSRSHGSLALVGTSRAQQHQHREDTHFDLTAYPVFTPSVAFCRKRRRARDRRAPLDGTFSDLSLTQPMIREQIAGIATAISALSGTPVTDCLALADLAHVRIAIGAPPRIAAEIDGNINAMAVACLLGDSAATLAQYGVVVHDRFGGIAIEVQDVPIRVYVCVRLLVRTYC